MLFMDEHQLIEKTPFLLSIEAGLSVE